MATESEHAAQNRINQQINALKTEFGSGVVAILKEANKAHLKNKGKLIPAPMVEHNSIRWSLTWQEPPISYELNVVVSIRDDGTFARVDRVWVHRHVTTPFDYEGHTPTTHMRRLTGLSLPEIRAAVEAEFR